MRSERAHRLVLGPPLGQTVGQPGGRDAGITHQVTHAAGHQNQLKTTSKALMSIDGHKKPNCECQHSKFQKVAAPTPQHTWTSRCLDKGGVASASASASHRHAFLHFTVVQKVMARQGHRAEIRRAEYRCVQEMRIPQECRRNLSCRLQALGSYPPPPCLVVPHPREDGPPPPPGRWPSSAGPPSPPWGTALPPYTHICRHRNCSIKRKNSA